jgi:hypothetical protein
MASTRDDDTQDLAQFEPDPDGQGTVESPLEMAGTDGGPDDPQWVVWTDAVGESDWADEELTQITAVFYVR